MFSFPYGFYEELNGFVKIVETKQFLHDVNVYKLPPTATLSAGTLHWLVANRKSDDSRSCERRVAQFREQSYVRV
jgi:hypothetical protein